jgi:RNA polymerase sigma factor FliA
MARSTLEIAAIPASTPTGSHQLPLFTAEWEPLGKANKKKRLDSAEVAAGASSRASEKDGQGLALRQVPEAMLPVQPGRPVEGARLKPRVSEEPPPMPRSSAATKMVREPEPEIVQPKRASRKPRLQVTSSAKMTRRDRVVMEHLPLVKAIAVRVHESLPVHVDLDDLVHAGIMGLFDAATKYNPDKKVVFSSYAKHRIKGAILDSLRQLDWASRDLRRRHKQVEQVTRDLSVELQRNPTEEEVATRMGVSTARWRQMALDLRNCGLISASTRSADQEELPAPDFPSKPETQPDSMCSRTQMKEVLESAMSILPERYKKVVVLYYTNELTMKEIGGMLGINESRVSQIHKSALEKMAHVLQDNGITSSQSF